MIHEFERDRGTNVVWYIINKMSKLHFGSTALLQYTGYTDVCLVRFAIISIIRQGEFQRYDEKCADRIRNKPQYGNGGVLPLYITLKKLIKCRKSAGGKIELY